VPARPSIKDVADRAGVSVGTVSNVLNRPHLVQPATLAKVRRVIDQLGFVRNESARQLRAGRSRTIGLVVLDVANPFFTDVARGVEDAASEVGMAVVLCNSDDRLEKEQRYLQLLAELRVSGVLIVPVDGADEQLAYLRRQGISAVLLDRKARLKSQCSVSVDDVAGGRMAAAHLLERGHRRLAFVGDHRGIPQVADRLRGAHAALKAAGVDPASLLVIDDAPQTVAGGRSAARRIADQAQTRRPTAAFCSNDLIALGMQQECSLLGLAVPEQLAIVGYDDIELVAAPATPLSSVRQPRQELGREAARLLIEEASGDPAHRHRQLVFEPELIVRDSSAARRSRKVSAGARGGLSSRNDLRATS